MIEIKKGIPVPKPPKSKGRPPEYPFGRMTAGDMIEVSLNPGETPENAATRARTAAASWRQRHGAKLSFVVRWCDEAGTPFTDDFGFDVVRVWAQDPRPTKSHK
jgi:hypothetical protein